MLCHRCVFLNYIYFIILFWSSLWFTLQPGFQNGQPYPITVLAMTLGELNFVDNFVSGLDRTFYYDNLTLFILFAMIMPISLMNLLVCSDCCWTEIEEMCNAAIYLLYPAPSRTKPYCP